MKRPTKWTRAAAKRWFAIDHPGLKIVGHDNGDEHTIRYVRNYLFIISSVNSDGNTVRDSWIFAAPQAKNPIRYGPFVFRALVPVMPIMTDGGVDASKTIAISQAIDDTQYGFPAVVNNIPAVVSASKSP